MSKPVSINSKGQRNRATGRFTSDEIEMHYRDMLRGLYLYEGDGLPTDMPFGWLEAEGLFYNSGIGFKNVTGLGFCAFGANPVYVNIYGAPTKWLPAQMWGMGAYDASKVIGLFDESDAPVMWNRFSQQERIRPYVDILRRAMNTLHVNLASLNHPTVIQGVASNRAGDNIASLMLESELDDGATFVPTVRPGDPLGLTAIDLGVSDNTQNLISTIDWADNRIQAVLGISTDTEKASGIGPYDASGTGALATNTDGGLELRKQWLEQVNDRFGTSITVRRNTDIEKTIQADDANGNPDDDREEPDSEQAD